MKKLILAAGLTLSLALATTARAAETVAQQRARLSNRLLPLKKITVGPDDQYSAAVDPQGKAVVYAHKADLVARLQIQDLKTGDVKDLLPLTADSQEPIFAPDGKLAFTYFRFNARGDICYVAEPLKGGLHSLEEKEIQCLKRDASTGGVQRLNPFWKSPTEIGYLERDINVQDSRIVVENIATGARRVLVNGRVWSPSMRAGGHLLAYNELIVAGNVSDRRLVIKDLNAPDQRHAIHLALPGLSGFPVFGEDESQLYFSHFMNDTNGDRAIDGSDNAVVFRLPVSRILSAKENDELFPEQLTSVENSCSFPRPFHDQVFVTCAFEGSLDLYSMPATGVVPAQWDEKLLTNALQTSRSYQDRILILNTMKFRSGKNEREFDERLLADHIYSDDTQAAQFYLRELQASASANDKRFYEGLGLYLQARELKKAQPTEEITREFRRQMQGLEERASKIKGEPRLTAAVRGLMRLFIDDFKGAQALVKATEAPGAERPLERYFVFEFASRVRRRDLPQSLPLLVADYKRIISAPEIGEESQVYYTFSLLKELGGIVKDPAKRIAELEKITGLPARAMTLVKAESVDLRLITAPDDAKKSAVYTDLDRIMIDSRKDYFLRKSLCVRSILNFVDAAEFKYLGYIATTWFKYTELSDTEYAYAKDVFSAASLDRAYVALGKKNYEFAANYFFESLSATDDLESHFGYITIRTQMGQRATVDQRYAGLKKGNYTGDNIKYAEALLTLLDAEPKAASDPSYTKHLDQAIEKLNSMEQDRDSSVRYLLLGYCYMEKLLRTANGADFNAAFFDESNRALMLAYDLGRDNERVRAAALQNLGLLHARVQNYGIASRFLALRKKIAFESDQDRAYFEYAYAEALAHSHQPDIAAEELASVPASVVTTPIQEREALNAAMADKYKEAVALYEPLLKAGKIQGDANLARVNLSYGYSLFKLQRVSEAQAALLEALQHASHSSAEKAGGAQIIEFKPDRIELVAYGLLGQMGTPDERRDALEKRAVLLQNMKKEVEDWLPLLIQNRLQLADVEAGPAAAAKISEALKLTEDYGKANQYLGNPVFRTLDGALALSLTKDVRYAKADQERLRDLYDKAMKAFGSQKVAQPALDFQRIKMELLWSGYTNRILGKREGDVASLLAKAEPLKSAMPVQWKELESLATAVQ